MSRQEARVVFTLGIALVSAAACDGRTPTPALPQAPVASSRPEAPPATASVAAASSKPKPKPLAERCAAPGPGRVSDDESPRISPQRFPFLLPPVTALDWLEARGVSKASALSWYRARFGRGGLDASQAEVMLGDAGCWKVAVGGPDHSEDALACEHVLPYGLMQVRATVIVVRSKRPVAVLDVGLGMRAMDFPEARQLDLALTIDADGGVAELEERAPEGTILVEPPSFCREREARLDKCEDALAKGETPESSCPILKDATGTPRVLRASPPMGSGYPATLHGCASAIAGLKEAEKDVAKAPAVMRKEAREAIAFLEKTCKERGRYVWRGDRFARP